MPKGDDELWQNGTQAFVAFNCTLQELSMVKQECYLRM
eukprot:COSAG01_NODE_2667_length_7280_cov_384.625400_4_plen_38_part_00